MSDIGIGIVIIIIIYIAYRAYEINMRLKILDMRHRILEILVRSPNDVDLKWLYDHHFGELYIGDYEKIVKFGRKNGLNLPLLTTEEEEERNKTKGD